MNWAFVIDSVPFTKAVRDGETSLGGSESACLGLARALCKRGHTIHIFTTQIADDAQGADASGCFWHDVKTFHVMNNFIEWDVVVALRWSGFFGQQPVYARLRLLWNQDLLVPGNMVDGLMSVAWAFDKAVYVSEYHRAQWEDLEPHVAGIGWTTRNGFDPADLPERSTKDPNRIIHISRPERGLKPLLAMWPQLRAKNPNATLQLCRYSSMYDEGGWGEVCRSFDREVARVNAEVGGITYLGELHKRQLYQAIADAAVMWYPGVGTFAETSCIAAVEAQACGTPFVGSLKGALPETAKPSFDAGLLIAGDAERDEAYHQASVDAVLAQLDGCARQAFAYRALQRAGKKHVEAYTYAVLAGEWEAFVEQTFRDRYASNQSRVLAQLLHEDDHVAAKLVADDILHAESPMAAQHEAVNALAFCDYVIAGKDQTAEQYGDAAIADPLKEIEFSGRFKAVWPMFEGCSSVLDVACGNGSFAIGLAKANPNVRVHGLDYSQANIDRATKAAAEVGLSDRLTFERVTVYDFDTQTLHDEFENWRLGSADVQYDGLFVGEFVEHVANCTGLIDGLEAVLAEDAQVVYTCPHGACAELVPRHMPLRRGHVHRFHHDDIQAVWGVKADFRCDYFAGGITERGNPIGNWLIQYRVHHGTMAGHRPLEARILRTRPLQKLSIGLIVKDGELDLARCLNSVWHVADEIVVGDTGSTDTTKAIAASFSARVIDVEPVDKQPEGFAGARNAVLAACTGDWFLWIDADEQLLDGHWLRRYLEGAVFNGYVLQQTHLYIDGPPTHDVPVRLFRTNKQIQFYGCIHEQPQMGTCNSDIQPTLEPFDVRIAHTGYLTERVRAEKRESRNLPLLLKDQQVFPERILGTVLCIREAVIQADEHRARHGGTLIAKAQQGYAYAIRMFMDHFDDPTHKYHKLARPWYEAALRHLGIGYEFEFALAGRHGGMEHRRAGAERFWVRDANEAERIVQWKVDGVKKGMVSDFEKARRLKVDPFVLPARDREQVSA